MFPIRDNVRSFSFPFINWLIIILNSLVFLLQSSLSPAQLDNFINTFALIPDKIHLANPLTWYPFLTHMWLHASFLHILSNMWFLAIFGDNVEDRLGTGNYLLFYIMGGVSAGMLQFYFSTASDVPALGASGAIAAVMGAYFLFFPKAKIVTFVPILLFIWFVDIPAIFFLGFWFATQILSGVASFSMPGADSGVAWWAHVGGFLFGMLAGGLFTIGKKKRPEYPDEYYPW
jgi:membrane associated rhomboid family serine protease